MAMAKFNVANRVACQNNLGARSFTRKPINEPGGRAKLVDVGGSDTDSLLHRYRQSIWAGNDEMENDVRTVVSFTLEKNVGRSI
jgi:hypothetical protein